MFRTLWTIISTLAVANLLAIGIFVGWLSVSGRISRERVEELRTIFTESVAAERLAAEEAAREAERAASTARDQERVGTLPVGSHQRAEIIREYDAIIRQNTRRAQRETDDLMQTLLARQAEFERERTEFMAERDEFNRMRAELESLEGSAQFRKTLKLLETMPADTARSVLKQLIDASEVTEAVAYLDAMKPRIAAKIVAGFEKDEPELAADLLRRLRVHGLTAVDPEG